MFEKKTKNDLIDSIYRKNSYERQEILAIVDEFLMEVKGCLEQGDTIELRGFGTFEPRLRNGRKIARNPKTGETLSVKPHYVAAFRAGQVLKEKLWKLIDEKQK
ncbi:MAG: integration host factor subunit beta [Treponema sp.]|nr:integration host factor subunit beta [Treponema sp.]